MLQSARSEVPVLDWRDGEEVRSIQLAREHIDALPMRREVGCMSFDVFALWLHE